MLKHNSLGTLMNGVGGTAVVSGGFENLDDVQDPDTGTVVPKVGVPMGPGGGLTHGTVGLGVGWSAKLQPM